MPYCHRCSEITLRKLYANAQSHGNGEIFEFSLPGSFQFSYTFPEDAYFRHHPSWEALKVSADGGCELCDVIYEELIQLSDETRESIENKISEGLETDIRICLDSFSEVPHEGHALPLNALVIQVGNGEHTPPLGEDFMDYDNPRIALQLIRPEGASDELRELNIGHPDLDPDLNSERNFDIARSWIRQCSLGHPATEKDPQLKGCGSLKKGRLPTRVIDVGSDPGGSPKLFVSNGESDLYIALSHCWGGGSSLTLTQENFQAFTVSIPMEKAPANFKDAIAITQNIGFRFLWIDSLCIIQDSIRDWETEAQRMSEVYKNAVLTVAASAAPNTTAGILNRYSPSVSTSLKHRCRLKLDESSAGEIYLIRRTPNEEGFSDCFVNLPLATRGWTLQEQMLSARNLYYGKRSIYWSCRSSLHSADNIPAGRFLSGLLPDAVPELFSDPNEHDVVDVRDVYFRWLGVVQVYSTRELTHESDKLPALSGLAAEVNRLTGAKYLAGIWREDLFNGLLWYPTLPQQKSENFRRGPSWSWVGIDTEFNFATRDMHRVRSPQDAEIVEVETILEGLNVYGAVRDGHMKLKGITREICRSRKKYYFNANNTLTDYMWKDKDQNEYTFFDSRTGFHDGHIPANTDGSVVPSDHDTIEGYWQLALILGVWAQNKDHSPSSIDLANYIDEDVGSWVYALLLRPSACAREATYERVGVLCFGLDSPFLIDTSWSTQTVKII